MGMIFQEYNLVERLTVMENVLSGRLGYVNFWQAYRRHYPPTDISAAFELLDRVGIEGYQDTRADALSGGQRQRVGIARALMQHPDLLLVDEPTASLDPKTSRQIMRLLCELAHERGTPALVNIHDVGLAQSYADRIIGLADGRVAFDGTPSELLAKSFYHNAVSVRIKADLGDKAKTVLGQVAGVSRVETIEQVNGMVEFLAVPKDSQMIIEAVNAEIQASGLVTEQVRVERGRLDEVFRQITMS